MQKMYTPSSSCSPANQLHRSDDASSASVSRMNNSSHRFYSALSCNRARIPPEKKSVNTLSTHVQHLRTKSSSPAVFVRRPRRVYMRHAVNCERYKILKLKLLLSASFRSFFFFAKKKSFFSTEKIYSFSRSFCNRTSELRYDDNKMKRDELMLSVKHYFFSFHLFEKKGEILKTETLWR